MANQELQSKIGQLQGPILVLGASGFIGANLFHLLHAQRDDVVGTILHTPAWRLGGVPEKKLVAADLLVDANLDDVLQRAAPRTVFNCVAYGAYSFEQDGELIYQTNFNLTAKLLRRLEGMGIACYVHSGSSSEYGDNLAGPREDHLPQPNSDYAVSKVACANLIRFYGRKKKLRCANLRLFSVYGPLEDSSRLIPAVIKHGSEGTYPPFVGGGISRDFVYVEDAAEAYVDTALNLREPHYGESFNIGSGNKTTIAEVARTSAELFSIKQQPVYGSMEQRKWDLADWFSNQKKTSEVLGWKARTDLRTGLALTAVWYRGLEDKDRYYKSSKQFRLDKERSISAIVACYKDGQAIPIMYQRLKKTFEDLKVDYEIIFVNDNSPDNSEEVIRELSGRDRHVVGISHSRNFGSQMAFRSGMGIASKNACVLLDGDLQDPPEIISQFVAKWKEGYDVVYGRRVRREALWPMRIAYKLFYRVFDAFSYLSIPHDAGDFSLIDRKAVKAILQYPERDVFLRGIRASVGFKQAGVDYLRPKRMFGRTTNSLLKNIGWAKKGILSFSYLPLSLLSFFGGLLFVCSTILGAIHVALRILYPGLAPRGLTTVILVILFFGSVEILGIGVLGEYIGRILEESKRRPHFIRRSIIKNGEARSVTDAPEGSER